MNDISVVALFCSDVRAEAGGTETIVGIYPNNVTVPKIPGAFAQMHVYVRMHLKRDFHPTKITTRLIFPGDEPFQESEMDMALVEKTRKNAVANDLPFLGLIARFAMAPLRISQEGAFEVIVSVDGNDLVAGRLNCKLAPDAAATTATSA